MSKTRTFIAVEASDEVYANALTTIKSLKALTDNMRWVAPDNLHWTLQFLGEVDDTDLYSICREVKRAAAEIEPFQLGSRCVAAFPSNEKPRTVWLGAGEGGEALYQLQDSIEARMADLGFRPERQRFKPHLTIGRVQQGVHGGAALTERLAELADFDGGKMEIDEVLIYGSELTREGPTYHVLGRAPLMGGG